MDAFSLSIANCNFFNLTSPCSKQINHSKEIEIIEITSTNMVKCMNPYNGLIVTPAQYSFICINSSFDKCSSNYSTKQPFISGNNSFSNDFFSVSSSGNGGAIQCEQNASLNIKNCTFDQCSTTNDGGAVSFESTKGSFMCDHCIFTNCHSNEGGAIRMFYNKQSTTQSTLFLNNSGKGKGHIIIGYLQSGSHLFQSNIFEKGECQTQYTGAFHTYLINSNITLSNNLFQHNSAKTYAPCVLLGDQYDNETVTFQCSFCLFQNNTAAQQSGVDVHISNSRDWNSLTKDNFVECYSLSQGTRVVRCFTRNVYLCTTSEALDWLPNYQTDFQIRAHFSEGINRDGCGLVPYCRTLKYSLTRNTNSTNTTILADSCEFCEETIEVGSEFVSLAGISREETIIRSLEGNNVFTVETGTLDINNCHLKHMDGVNGTSNCFLVMSGNGKTTVKKCDVSCVDEQNEVHSSVFKVNAGYALLEEVRMFEIRFSSCCAISFEQEAETCVLEIISTNSSKLTRANGGGSIAEGTLSSGGKIIVSYCMLEESVCEDGNGGAMSIYVEDEGKIEVNGTECTKFSKCRARKAQNGQTRQSGYGGGIYVYFSDSSHSISLTNVSFEECNAQVGSDIFINGNVLKEIVSKNTFNFVLDLSNLSALCGIERSASLEHIIPLVCFLRQWNGAVHVNGSEGTDFSGCGFDDCPCQTIEAAVALRFPDQKRMVMLGTGFVLDNEVHLEDHEYAIGDENLPVSISVNGISQKQSDELLLVSISTSICGISFVLPSSLNQRSSLIRSSFDLSNPSTLSLRKCSFLLSAQEEISCELTYSLLSATGGNLIIDRVSASKLIFGRCSAFAASSSTMNITEMILNNTQTTSTCGLISLAKENLISSANSSSNTFSNKMPKSTDILVNNSNFISCEAQNSLKGGCVFIEYCEGMKLEIKDSIFMLCKAPRGKGGGAYLNCDCEGELSFQFTDDIFNMNDALSGRDIFVCCTSLETQISEKQFRFHIEEPAYNTKNAIFGSDIHRGSDEEDVNIIDLIMGYRNDLIFIGNELHGGTILKNCGRATVPCLTLNHGLERLTQSFESRIVVNGSSTISSECNLQDLSIRSISKAITSLLVNSDINCTRDSLMCCAGNVWIEYQSFIFGISFSSLHQTFFFLNSGEVKFTRCSFKLAEADSVRNSQQNSMASIPFTLLLIDSSNAILQSCELEDSSCKNTCFICKNSAKLQIQDFSCRRVVLHSPLVIDTASAELSHICLDAVTCMTSIFVFEEPKKNSSLEWIDARNITLKKGSVFSVNNTVQTEQKQPFFTCSTVAALCVHRLVTEAN
ncbi:uncharacterized protein MONOS_14699 [Monocercomonoides exilis]|uniref:uncharacterized protein n=1 Tax=Monocercomonoides exilis TaxID=2049356 RepID=UPI00355A76F7|nr:hypothetical protein MONOS_14699 [Monocercomonoides exilis]|eukprot:MONOS_14699.1-p1 / transcript=MONOS_14699.1 / gene=MONOS_14699 / organism=Monocercomonoides_exilis_PA203 / gene_product=unspecified product / transcript_product=unspecified product / location=Mono_scaffold01053:14532-18582(+) / protein_length=1319 / sequence_SO=supercontig / SO=protein_coding / is_pseudo=false